MHLAFTTIYGLPEDAPAILYGCPPQPAGTRTLALETSWDLPALGPGATANVDVTVPAATRERIALAVANVNGCTYCNSAHSYIGKNMLKLDEAEIAANRAGRSNDPKAEAAVRFAQKVAVTRGAVANDDLRAVRMAGYSDAQLVEIVLHVVLNVLTNYVNEVFATDVDFPVIAAQRAA
ncbi:carboxymuconolactone decarboxylase family protein [Roseomonas sp. BU-1]|uniref:Carboxymuconolactone decarboxylase family protein n=1 Tax=Falsiroseomonas selenitidurans TaxID=2716335 RepID=A0ABX1EAK8_9PROT|nr:carboxymuconolactone decarboxylase family protein [Falsiroseomonas selenitidurans]